MKRIVLMLLALLVAATLALAATVGQPAPTFTATDSNGQTHNLADYKGKVVVLEWHNNGCPYTKKHYDSGNMQKLQKEWTAKGVVWLTVISSAPGTQGYVTPAQENAYMAEKKATPTAALLDATGEIGHLYNARTTPQMIVIDKNGTLVYDGAIDDKPTSDASDIPGAVNYVSAALGEMTVGKAISNPTTRPYGCSVKYAR